MIAIAYKWSRLSYCVSLHSIVFQLVVVQGQEDDVHDDAEGDDDFGEGVENDEGHDLAEFDPQSGAVPDAQDVDHVLRVVPEHALEIRTFVVVVILDDVSPNHGRILKTSLQYTC